MTVAVTIKNVGATSSRCRVLLFVKPVTLSQTAPLPLPVKSIVDFGGTMVLPPGGSETLSLAVTLDALSLTDWSGKRAASVALCRVFDPCIPHDSCTVPTHLCV